MFAQIVLVFTLLGLWQHSAQAAEERDWAVAAEKAYQAGQFQDALDIYERALSQEPLQTRLLSNIGWTLAQAGEIAGAKAAYLGVLQRRPYDPDALFNLKLLGRLPGQAELSFDFYPAWSAYSPARLASEFTLFWLAVATLSVLLLVGTVPASVMPLLGLRKLVLALLLSLLVIFSFGTLDHAQLRPELGVISKDSQNLMSGPTVHDAMAILPLSRGTAIEVLAKSGTWFKVSLADGKKGWIPESSFILFGKRYLSLPAREKTS